MKPYSIFAENVLLKYAHRNTIDVSAISRKFYFSNYSNTRNLVSINKIILPSRHIILQKSVSYFEASRGSVCFVDRHSATKNSQRNTLSTSYIIGRNCKMKRPNYKTSDHAHNGDEKDSGFKIYKWGINEWSNFAAILCAIDCTLLPLLTAFLPIVGFLGDGESLHSFHEIAEWLALVIVIPLAGFASIANYIQIQRLRLFILSLFGICLVFLSHNHALVHSFPHDISEIVHNHHTLLSLIGACCLLSSNYISHTIKHTMKKSCCFTPSKEGVCHRKNCSKGNYTLVKSRNTGDSQSD